MPDTVPQERLKSCPDCNAPRQGDVCHKCGATLVDVADGWTWPRLPPVERIRTLAREVGYAVGIHGTQERDLDLIAAPWVDEAVSPEVLAEHIAKGINGRVLDPGPKPLGRWACNIQIDGWFKLIDLSVSLRTDTAALRAQVVEPAASPTPPAPGAVPDYWAVHTRKP